MRPALLLLLWTACAPVLANERCYTADASSAEVTFRVMQSGAPFSGAFRRFSGQLCFAQGRLSRIDAALDPSSVDTGLPELDAVLKEKDFFAVREFPRVTFTSSSVQAKGDMHTARGTLEIKGIRRETEITLRSQQTSGKMSVIGSLTLDRLHYGVGTGEWSNTQWLGAEVRIDVKALLTIR